MIKLAIDDEVQSDSLTILDRVRVSMKNTKHLSKSLVGIKRYHFNAFDPEDRLAYLVFSKTGKWIKQYYNEISDKTVVETTQRKMLEYAFREEVDKAKHLIDTIDANRSQAHRTD